jgi:hypothetical protein
MTERSTVDTASATPTGSTGAVSLGELARGTARVAVAVVRPGETLLYLGYPGGRRVTVTVPGEPQQSGAGAGWTATMRPVAVRMTTGQATLDCSVLATTPSGPTRVPITVDEALRLCASGVHTVLYAH